MRSSIERILPSIKNEDFDKDFRNLEIDSIDLVSLRVEIENKLGKMIPNQEWLSFKNLKDILNYSDKEGFGSSEKPSEKHSAPTNSLKNFINMPQMCLEGLSENWLFKESGSLHWDLLCKGLNTSSSELKDDLGNRLYATFVRIRMDGSDNLSCFGENNPFEFKAELSRFGMGMFFSNINFNSESKHIKIEMMTSFSIRKSTGDNKSLAKSQPTIDFCDIPQFSEFPAFGNEYRLIKKNELKTFFYKNYVFQVTDNQIFKYEYSLNPYYDLNGVGLLYFASYPIINDFCELQYFKENGEINREENYFTLFRDVMYYANCDAQDTIIYTLNSVENLTEGKVKICSSLHRKSDQTLMAKIFSIKQNKNF